MRRYFWFLCTAIMTTLLCACALLSGGNTENGDNPVTLHIEDYFPIKENTRYTYEGIGNEYASYTVTVDYTGENKVQQRVNNGGTVAARVLALSDGKLILQSFQGEIYYRENFLDKSDGQTDVLLMEPLKTGTTWKRSDGSTCTIANISAEISTPLGTYAAIEVTTEGEYGKTSDYYAKDIGLVKTIYTSEGYEVSSSLSKIEENISYVQSISFFFPNIDDGVIYFTDQDVSFRTNEITSEVLTDVYKSIANENFGSVLSENAAINSMYLDDDQIVRIDFNEAFVREMNAGSGYEAMILQSIANTFGKYYNSEKVSLTIDGKPYESGHILLAEGEYLKTNLDDTAEIK